MGPQGARWPRWKQRADNSSQAVTDDNRRKKLHHGVKCIRKVRLRFFPIFQLFFFLATFPHLRFACPSHHAPLEVLARQRPVPRE